MAKKIFLTIFFSVVLLLSFFTISFAESSSNTTTTLGNEVTNSMNKTERSMNDLVDRTDMDNVGRTIENGARAIGNTMKNGMNAIENGVEDIGNNTKSENRIVSGTTGNYLAGQQVQDVSTTNNTGMAGNTWIWIIMIVVALIVVALVWYYAAAQNQ